MWGYATDCLLTNVGEQLEVFLSGKPRLGLCAVHASSANDDLLFLQGTGFIRPETLFHRIRRLKLKRHGRQMGTRFDSKM